MRCGPFGTEARETAKLGKLFLETAWPADRVQRRAVAGLLPDARNARTHADAQIDRIAASIREWGWTVPVLVDESGRLIAGHGRVRAAQKLGLPEIPVMVASGPTFTERDLDRYLAKHLARCGRHAGRRSQSGDRRGKDGGADPQGRPGAA